MAVQILHRFRSFNLRHLLINLLSQFLVLSRSSLRRITLTSVIVENTIVVINLALATLTTTIGGNPLLSLRLVHRLLLLFINLLLLKLTTKEAWNGTSFLRTCGREKATAYSIAGDLIIRERYLALH